MIVFFIKPKVNILRILFQARGTSILRDLIAKSGTEIHRKSLLSIEYH